MSKVIIFGGSFDPIHSGHLFIAKKALAATKADKVIFMLAKNPRWKTPNVKAIDRLEMLKIAIEPYSQYEMSLLEYNSAAEINFTIDTVKTYKQQNREDDVVLLIGADQLDRLQDWKDIDELAKLARIAVYGRCSAYLHKENIERFNVLVIEGENIDVSSTDIRHLKDANAPKSVLKYILDNDLYFAHIVKERFSEHRYLHSCSVALLAYEIAQANNMNYSDAFIAGILHDIAKEIKKEDAVQFMQNKEKDNALLPKFTHHQFVGAYIAQEEFGITNQNILNAIKYHATGRDNMSELEKIIYASDKIDPLRGFDSEELINACCQNIDIGFMKVLQANKEYLLGKHLDIENPLTKACLDYYLK